MKLFNTTLAWCEGMDQWQPAKEIDDLRQITFGLPPPLPKEKIKAEEWVKVILCHSLFGFGLFYANHKLFRKWIYPILAFYAFLDALLAGLELKPFNSYEFGLTTFIASLTIVYGIGFVDVLFAFYKDRT